MMAIAESDAVAYDEEKWEQIVKYWKKLTQAVEIMEICYKGIRNTMFPSSSVI